MFGIFKKKNEKAATDVVVAPVHASPAPAPASVSPPVDGIAYYPDLIRDLVADHHKLLQLHEEIMSAFAQADLLSVSAKLKEFGALVRNHLLTENMRLYIYLQQKMAGDEINTTLVRSFRKEMDGIARTALEFLEKYSEIEKMNKVGLAMFTTEFEQIGKVVHARMRREEETLYPLYAASY